MTNQRICTALLAPVVVLALLAVACEPGSAAEEVDLGDPYQLPTSDLAGFEAELRDLRGTPVVVNIWASWCGPCILEAPHLAAAAERYEGRVQFLGVDILDGRDSARDFIRRFGWPYPSLFDPTAAIRDGLGFFGVPITVFYDANGEQVSTYHGPIPADVLEERIAEVL
jgi:thiol-disulfide isomerase/thioredoxin